MSDATVESGKIDLGRVIGGTFQVIGRNIVTFSVLGLLLCGLPQAIVGYFQADLVKGQLGGLASGNFSFNSGAITGGVMGGLASLITMAILQGALIYATVQDLSGRKPAVGESLAVGLRNFLPLIGLTILLAIAIVCGLVLLIVPGIMLICAWCVALPALIADRTGVFGAFGRSAELTRGNRWSIFGLVVIIFVISIVADTITNSVLGISPFVDPIERAEQMLSPLGIALLVIRATIVAVVGSAAVSVLYVELRQARQGLGPEWLREIFA